MKRREWLKSLFCAPLALVSVTQRTSESIAEPPITIHIEGTVITQSQFSDAVVNALNQAQKMGRFSRFSR